MDDAPRLVATGHRPNERLQLPRAREIGGDERVGDGLDIAQVLGGLQRRIPDRADPQTLIARLTHELAVRHDHDNDIAHLAATSASSNPAPSPSDPPTDSAPIASACSSCQRLRYRSPVSVRPPPRTAPVESRGGTPRRPGRGAQKKTRRARRLSG